MRTEIEILRSPLTASSLFFDGNNLCQVSLLEFGLNKEGSKIVNPIKSLLEPKSQSQHSTLIANNVPFMNGSNSNLFNC